MASLQGRPQRLCMREAQTTRNTLHSRLHQQFVTDILLVNYPMFVSFVAPETVGVECAFTLSTCGYILGQQWMFDSPGSFNILYFIDHVVCIFVFHA